jgi:hypothetical protein
MLREIFGPLRQLGRPRRIHNEPQPRDILSPANKADSPPTSQHTAASPRYRIRVETLESVRLYSPGHDVQIVPRTRQRGVFAREISGFHSHCTW